MNLLFIAKYPPIQGGEATKLYWLAKALGEKGHRCSIVSDGYERESKCELSLEDFGCLQPENVRLYSLTPWEVTPSNKPFTGAKLSNLALEVLNHEKVDLMVGWYLLPYAESAYQVARMNDTPFVIQHAGSDMARLFHDSSLKSYLMNILNSADGIMSYPSQVGLFRHFTDNVFVHKPCVDLDSFEESPEYDLGDLEGKKVLLFLGKMSRKKGVHELVEAYKRVRRDDSALLFVGAGKEREKIDKEDDIHFLDPVPPWRVPGLIRASYACVIPENNFGVLGHTSRIPMETMASGRVAIISEDVKEKGSYRDLKDGESCLVINPRDIGSFSSVLERALKNSDMMNDIALKGNEFSRGRNNFGEYVNSVERYLESIIS